MELSSLLIPLGVLNLLVSTGIWLTLGCRSKPRRPPVEEYSDEEFEDEVSDSDIIAEIRSATLEEESPKSIENMTGKLISVTKNIADALDGASNIPSDKKKELATLLKGVPEFISKITKMDHEELGAVLTRNTPQSELPIDHIKESEFLMQTLDSLRR